MRVVKQSPAAWSRAYAIQARADLATYETLKGTDLPACQRLHFLQMACEKVAKAHRCWGGADPANLQTSHLGVAKVIPIIARQLYARRVLGDQVSHAKAMSAIHHLARQVELLAPSIDDGGRRPENCEYPWEDERGDLRIPAVHDFSELSRLPMHHAGGTFLKVIATAVEELAAGTYVTSS
jgi:hypothetical protein